MIRATLGAADQAGLFSAAGQQPQAMLPELLAARPEMKVNSLRFQMPSGQFDSELSVKLAVDQASQTNCRIWYFGVSSCCSTVRFVLISLAQFMTEAVMRQQLRSQVDMGIDPSQIDDIVAQQAEPTLNMVASQFFQDAGDYKLAFHRPRDKRA